MRERNVGARSNKEISPRGPRPWIDGPAAANSGSQEPKLKRRDREGNGLVPIGPLRKVVAHKSSPFLSWQVTAEPDAPSLRQQLANRRQQARSNNGVLGSSLVTQLMAKC